jgi:hypothetical protein
MKQRYKARKPIRVTKAVARSAITNGSRLLDGLDERSRPARRYRDVQFDIANDLGGMDALTETQRHVVRSIAGLVVLREALDVKLLNGEDVHTATYCTIANTLNRLVTTIGLRRVPRDITPGRPKSFQEYIKRPAGNGQWEA